MTSTELAHARQVLEERRLAPLWQRADHPALARGRVLRFVAHRLGLEGELPLEALTLEQCRAAWVAVAGVTYPDVRDWATKARGTKRVPA